MTKILWTLLQFKFGFGIIQRIMWFINELNDNQSLDIQFQEKYEVCQMIDPMYRSTLRDCTDAKEYMRDTGSAYWRATHFIIERTHSCIDIPCSSLLETILNSWTAILIAAIVIVIYSQALASKIKKLKIPSFATSRPLLPSSSSTSIPIGETIGIDNDFLVKKKQ